MKKLGDIDKNFKIESTVALEDLHWYDPTEAPFTLLGTLWSKEEGYRRLPEALAESLGENIAILARHTSSGRITFETTSPYVAIYAKVAKENGANLCALGARGFDLYEVFDGRFEFTAVYPPVGDTVDTHWPLGEGVHKVVINMPLYSEVEELYIGLAEGATVSEYYPYKLEAPIVYYGSSITQGGCASRPGNNYTSLVSHVLGRDFECFGFSGGAHGEVPMAEYIAARPMSAFVLDYDHNDCSDREALSERHERFYKMIRAAHPDIPIIIMSAPYAARTFFQGTVKNSLPIVKKTYLNAKERGERVYFINGSEMFTEFPDAALTDRVHPNTFGFVMMAKAVLNVFKQIEEEDKSNAR